MVIGRRVLEDMSQKWTLTETHICIPRKKVSLLENALPLV